MAIEAMTQSAIREIEVVEESPFYIPMTGPAARPRRALKHDDTFVVLDSHGDIGASAGGPDGLFNADTRYLARLELVLDGVQPLLLGSNLRDDNSALTVDLTNPDVYRNERIVLQKDMLHIVRTIFLWRGTAYQRIGLQNHGDRPARFDLTLLFDNDFADLFVAASCDKPAAFKPARFLRGLLAHRREMRRSTAGATSIETSNNIFNEVLCQSMADLNMLMTETPQGRYPYAGIPWYSTTFGRDGLITALQMLWIDPRVARGVLKRLAFYQAKSIDPLADAEPGKILHEMRGGEMAALREVPFAQYYGSGVALDRRRRRSRSGWICRVSARLRAGIGQPGLERFLRRHLSCRRTACRGLHRAIGSAGICVRRQAPRSALRAPPGLGG